jgi:hypothetical protein
MPPLVTTNATIMCAHGGRVTLIPRQMQVTVQGGGLVLCEPDLVGAPIVGCAQPPSPTTKPCTMVISTFPGSTSLKVMVGGRRAYVGTLTGLTDGVPPGGLIVPFPGQAIVQA